MTRDIIKETFDDLSGNTPYGELTERDFYFYAMGYRENEVFMRPIVEDFLETLRRIANGFSMADMPLSKSSMVSILMGRAAEAIKRQPPGFVVSIYENMAQSERHHVSVEVGDASSGCESALPANINEGEQK